jgi:predicted Zn-dependent peptidase
VWPRPPASNDDRAAGTLYGEYVAPLLYQEVRESRGLAYTTFGGFSPGGRKGDAAQAFAFAGTQGDKTHDALDAIQDTIKKPVDDVRFKEAQAAIAQKFRTQRIAPRAVPFNVWGWLDQGEKADPRAARTERIAKLDKAALERWIKATLAAPMIVSIAGDRKKLDEAKLKKLAPVTWIPVDKLFGY